MIGVALTLLMLLIATVLDIKKREVGNILWFVFGLIGLALIFFETQGAYSLLFNVFMNVFLVVFVVAILFALGRATTLLYIGDADLKGLIVLALLNYNLGWFFSLAVFVGGLVLVLLIPIYLFLRNSFESTKIEKEYADNKFMLYFLGRKVKITKASPLFSTPLELIRVSGKKVYRTLSLVPNIEPEEDFKRLRGLVKQKKIKDEIWVTPLPPFMVFMLIAYIAIWVWVMIFLKVFI